MLQRWTRGYLLRFLQAKKFDCLKAMESIIEHGMWRKANMPLQLTDPIKKYLVISNY